MWTNLANNQLFSHQLFEWLKFIELSMAMIMGVVEDERCLSNMGFMKSKLRNRLTSHLDLVVKMFISYLHWTFSHLLQQWVLGLLQNSTMLRKDSSNNQKSLNLNLLCNMLFMCFCYDICNTCPISFNYIDLVGMSFEMMYATHVLCTIWIPLK
jgi:hypothetical protein